MGYWRGPGPDPHFPYLTEDERFTFPDPEACEDWIVAVGGNLSPGMLLSAYEQGIFPWYNPEDPLIWQSPDPRLVIYPETLHISESMRKLFKKNILAIRFDTDFEGVIHGCGMAPRPGQNGTWISQDIITAYTRLHRLGWAHSAEAYLDGELVGGCYGIRIGNVFCGESMFARYPNASKAAFLTLAQFMFSDGLEFIDCQVPTNHLISLGGQVIDRSSFLRLLKQALSVRESLGMDRADRRGSWAQSVPEF
ncbi:MAG TPA: leucyl/phenylalanyl-tRNA--protein transferase [Treponema sp.]|nr:leucyl/phenylalanyl-tRNA--protein transferase [Treponema sp.]HPC71850.1 leucyl/phenylalanyl-tRNA--protein transferase [Treponema sp.]HRS04467.1 leucyl/phenylalanyl-tRNA--protein transferase [Treponema sp.]HRU29096.1 leucyl/phenylalanyl-tRNA--protein transferase [Treponema sp.]